jgi:hypothetical protein
MMLKGATQDVEREMPSKPIANCEPCVGHSCLARLYTPWYNSDVASIEVTKHFMIFLTGFEGISCLRGYCKSDRKSMVVVVIEPIEETNIVILLNRCIKLYSCLCPQIGAAPIFGQKAFS